MTRLAADFVRDTGRCVFLTGKAGTGKTTFLKQIRQVTRKNLAVVAPTGVAAINAGGTTIHSFFQLPFAPYIPPEGEGALFETCGLLRNLRIDTEKRNVFKNLELLIIDEVSMVRCDVLDSVDAILRFFRRKEHLPFGGVQVLLIGDLFQLPPVVQTEEWELLRNHYQSPFFFDSRVIRHAKPVYIELREVFRQTDVNFINLLNRIRNNEVSDRDFETLNARYDRDFVPDVDDGYITLTTHNYKADKMNADALAKIDWEPVVFEGAVEGDFPERNFPTDQKLALKVGAQVMFIKNDMDRVRRYFNGKIGIVHAIRNGNVTVRFPGETTEVEVEKETWRNVRYTYNPVTSEVEEDVLGTFTQYPLRLAWAVTIHKSQGLTFDRVIIDAGASFSPGQVYVALSRCTSLDGIVLYSKIAKPAIRTDPRVIDFSRNELTGEELGNVLDKEQQQFKLSALLEVFDWEIALEETVALRDQISEKRFIDKEAALDVFLSIEAVIRDQSEVSKRFSAQIRALCHSKEFAFLLKRVIAAADYFCGVITEKILPPLLVFEAELAQRKKVKKVRKDVKELITFFNELTGCFRKAWVLADELTKSENKKESTESLAD